MLKKLGILFVLDLILIWIWLSTMHLDPSVGIFIIIIVPVCFLVNLVAGLILRAFKHSWGYAVLINSVIASIIAFSLFGFAMESQTRGAYKDYYFNRNAKAYNLMIHQSGGKLTDSLSFECYELQNGGSEGTNLNGKYVMKHDTLVLTTDSGRVVLINRDILFNYPGQGDTLHLRENR